MKTEIELVNPVNYDLAGEISVKCDSSENTLKVFAERKGINTDVYYPIGIKVLSIAPHEGIINLNFVCEDISNNNEEPVFIEVKSTLEEFFKEFKEITIMLLSRSVETKYSILRI